MSSISMGARASLAPSVQSTLRHTFVTVGAMLALMAAVSMLTLNVQLGLGLYLACFVASLALIFATQWFRNSAWGLVCLAAFAALEGVTLGPLLSHYMHLRNGAAVVAGAAGLTGLATFGCAAYAITTRRDFSRLRGFLCAGLLVVIVAAIAGIFIQLPAFHLTLSAVTALLFVGWILYDVGAIVSGEETNYISASLGIFLDLLNLFLSLLRLLGVLSSDD